MLNRELKQYIQQQIIPRYETFDAAHRTDHARAVIARSLELARQYDADENMVYVIAAYHDMGLSVEREQHHIISGQLLMEDPELPRWFSAEQLETMRDAVEDHRASSNHAPRTIYGRLVAEADRLIEPETIIRRTLQYGIAHYPTLDREGHFGRLREHLQRKYAEGGYLQLWIPKSDNARQLRILRVLIQEEVRLRALFDRLYTAE
ncbi:MAG: HD domain-containing protein, partial [Alistipes sp.]